MRFAFLGFALLALIFSQPAAAQVAAPQASSPRASLSTSEFRRLALIGAYFDFESSRLALQKSTRGSVRRYAASLVQNFRIDFTGLSQGAGLFESVPALSPDPQAPPPRFVDERRAAMLNQLATASGRSFDRLYLDMQLGTRQETLGLYEAFLQTGSDTALTAFVRAKLPVLQQETLAIRRIAGR